MKRGPKAGYLCKVGLETASGTTAPSRKGPTSALSREEHKSTVSALPTEIYE